MATHTVTLTDDQVAYVESRVGAGGFADAAAVVAAGLKLLADEEAAEAQKIERLRAMIQEGIDAVERGEYETIPPGGVSAYVDSLRARVRGRIA